MLGRVAAHRARGVPSELPGDGGIDDLVSGAAVHEAGGHPPPVIGRQEPPVRGACDEGLADLPAFLGPHRDVLEIGIAGAEPAGGRDALVEGGVDPAGGGVKQIRQGVHVGAFQLGDLAVFQNFSGQRMSEGRQAFERALVRAGLARDARPALRGQRARSRSLPRRRADCR